MKNQSQDLLAPWCLHHDRVIAPGLYSGRGKSPDVCIVQDLTGHITPAEQAFLRRAIVNVPLMLRALDLTIQALQKAPHDQVARDVALLASLQAVEGLGGQP